MLLITVSSFLLFWSQVCESSSLFEKRMFSDFNVSFQGLK